MSAPIGYTIFCDDIRFEISGKVSYIGCYTGELRLVRGEFPAKLPKLGMAITIHFPGHRAPDRLKLTVYFPGDPDNQPSIEGELSGVDQPPVDDYDYGPDVEKRISVVQNLVFSPVEIKEEGLIKVRAEHDGNVIKLGTLRVAVGPLPDERI